jgi:hypothetical protein
MMANPPVKKKVFVTPEKPCVAEKTCWVEDDKLKKVKAKRRKN